ncbi:hypothetical protein BVRB_6g152740 [Beta vulgaris subsp. vulgaris]|nr:hypothetical protein BVRB_6g152740 [Beta vulgaris subsp. vulgaris]
MLEALLHTGKDQELKLDDEDEELIKTIFNNRAEYVQRIDDEDWDDDIANDKVKKPKLSEDVSKPTDVLTKNNSNEDLKPTLQPPAVKFTVKRKQLKNQKTNNL